VLVVSEASAVLVISAKLADDKTSAMDRAIGVLSMVNNLVVN
jgi:hypothetical protein